LEEEEEEEDDDDDDGVAAPAVWHMRGHIEHNQQWFKAQNNWIDKHIILSQFT
jgi:hypothetical protein